MKNNNFVPNVKQLYEVWCWYTALRYIYIYSVGRKWKRISALHYWEEYALTFRSQSYGVVVLRLAVISARIVIKHRWKMDAVVCIGFRLILNSFCLTEWKQVWGIGIYLPEMNSKILVFLLIRWSVYGRQKVLTFYIKMLRKLIMRFVYYCDVNK